MKKFLGSLLIIVLAAVVFLIVAKDWVLKAAIEQFATRLTGFETKLDDLKYDFPSTLSLKGLEIQNPAGFNQKIFVNIPEIYVSLVFRELVQGKRIHLRKMLLNIQEVNIEKRPDGVSNVELLSSVGGSASKPAAQEPASAGEMKAGIPFLLETLELTVRNVSFEDRSGILGAAPVVPKKLSVDLNLQKEVFSDIQDPAVLVNLIVVKILNSATLGRLLNIDPQKLLGENLSGALNTGQLLVTKGAGTLTKELGSAASQASSYVEQAQVSQKADRLLKGSVGGAKDVVGDTTSIVKDQVSGLFGKLKSLPPTQEKPAEKTA